jgi:hypothetical protein
MKGVVVSLRIILVALLVGIVSLGLLLFVTKTNVSASSVKCGNGFCEASQGEDVNSCPEDCQIVNMSVEFGHVLFEPGSEENFDLSNLTEYLSYSDGGGENCYNGATCSECKDVYLFNNTQSCNQCMSCDEFTGKCQFCDNCLIGNSDYEQDTNSYENISSCYNCEQCSGIDSEDNAESCETCKVCEDTDVKALNSNYAACDYCSRCDSSGKNCEGCVGCYNIPKPSDDITNYNICNKCNTGTCSQQAEPWICERIKDCMRNNDGSTCDIDLDLPLSGMNYDSAYGDRRVLNIINTLSTAIGNCRSPDAVYADLPDGGEQFVCNISDSSLTSERADERVTSFNDCGSSFEYIPNLTAGNTSNGYWNIKYNAFAFNPNAAGIHYRITISRLGYGTPSISSCEYNLNVCGQVAIATNSEDSIQDFYSKIIFADTYYWTRRLDIPNWKVVQLQTIRTNLSISKTPAEMADSVVAGLRDFSILIDNNESKQDFCNILGLNADNCAEVNVIGIDGVLPWKLNALPVSTQSSECDDDILSFSSDRWLESPGDLIHSCGSNLPSCNAHVYETTDKEFIGKTFHATKAIANYSTPSFIVSGANATMYTDECDKVSMTDTGGCIGLDTHCKGIQTVNFDKEYNNVTYVRVGVSTYGEAGYGPSPSHPDWIPCRIKVKYTAYDNKGNSYDINTSDWVDPSYACYPMETNPQSIVGRSFETPINVSRVVAENIGYYDNRGNLFSGDNGCWQIQLVNASLVYKKSSKELGSAPLSFYSSIDDDIYSLLKEIQPRSCEGQNATEEVNDVPVSSNYFKIFTPCYLNNSAVCYGHSLTQINPDAKYIFYRPTQSGNFSGMIETKIAFYVQDSGKFKVLNQDFRAIRIVPMVAFRQVT